MTAAAALAPSDSHSRPALRVVVRPAPRREPPFDDELGDAPVVSPWDRRLPFESPHADLPAFSALPRPDALPQPAAWARRLLVGLIESAAGRRPVGQLGGMLAFPVLRGLAADFERAANGGGRHWLHRASVGSLRCSEPAAGVAELSATLRTGGRVRAAALRLEEHQGRWRCTLLQLG